MTRWIMLVIVIINLDNGMIAMLNFFFFVLVVIIVIVIAVILNVRAVTTRVMAVVVLSTLHTSNPITTAITTIRRCIQHVMVQGYGRNRQ